MKDRKLHAGRMYWLKSEYCKGKVTDTAKLVTYCGDGGYTYKTKNGTEQAEYMINSDVDWERTDKRNARLRETKMLKDAKAKLGKPIQYKKLTFVTVHWRSEYSESPEIRFKCLGLDYEFTCQQDIETMLDMLRQLPKRYAVMQAVTKQVIRCFRTNKEAQHHKHMCGSQYIVKDLLAESEIVVEVEPAAIPIEE